MSELQTITYGSRKIDFLLTYSVRKSLSITVTPSLDVLVKAPLEAELEKIIEKVKKRAAWIIKQQAFFQSFLPKMPPKRFVSGETHYYLGKQYRLKVEKHEKEVVKLTRGYLWVYHSSTDVKELLEEWYRKKALQKFSERLQHNYKLLEQEGISMPQLVIRQMPKRWGSCSEKGKILLNPELIRAPTPCIDYVIIHELCHMKEYNHSSQFYTLLAKYSPDWEKWKNRLEEIGSL